MPYGIFKIKSEVLLKKVAIIEIILVMITGVLLTLVRFSEGGINSINKMAEGVENNSTVIYVLLAFLVLAIASRLIRKFFGITVYNHKEKMQVAEDVFEGVGSGLLGIYRLISGIAITVPFIWCFTDQDSFDLARALVVLFIGGMFFVGLLLLSWANDKSKVS